MSPDAREYIRQIQSSGKHLLVIINDILDFSKIDSGKMEIIETTYKPESLIEDISHLVNSRIGTKDLDFLIDIPYDLPLELIGDNIRIQQVLVNLLTNAIKFTPRGKITLRLSHTPIDENSIMIHAKVEDTGNGIKKEDLNKLFESFQQVDSKRNRNIEGTGLGLAISKQLMQLMNGTISVSSEYGKGSIFSIDFPQKIFQKAPKIQISEQYPAVYILLGNQNVKEQLIQDLAKVGISPIDLSETNLTGTGKVSYFITERSMINCNFLELASQHGSTNFIVIDTYNGPNDLKAPNIKILRKPVTSINLLSAMGIGNFEEHSTEKGDTSFAFTAPEADILIVDDNHVNLTVAKGLLEPLHMKIDLADSAAECIEQIKQKTYDIIFMDHMMPEVDGIETTHIIRRMIPGYENVPIIALTANAVGGAREMFLQEGMNDFLAKPIETGKIVAMVKKWLPEEKIMPIDKSAQAAKTGMPCSCKLKGDTVLDQLIENRNLFPGGSTLLNDLATEGLNVSSALALVGTEKLYLQIVKEYYLAIDKHAELIEKAYQEKRIKDYVIEVHSLKSSSKQIGADSLSAYAALLEKAGNENDLSLLQYGTPALLEDLRKLQNSLRPLFPELNTEKTLPTADKNAILQCLSELQDALNTMDTLAIDEAMDKFHGFDYESQTTKKYLEQLTGAAEEFDIDSCLEIAAAWKEELESE